MKGSIRTEDYSVRRNIAIMDLIYSRLSSICMESHYMTLPRVSMGLTGVKRLIKDLVR